MKRFLLIAVVGLLAAFNTVAQVTPLYNATNTYTLARLLDATMTRDTVTNNGTGFLTSKQFNGAGTVTIQVNLTKVSGTVAGTLSLLGSLDGVNFKALTTEETATALATHTLTDATNVYQWRLAKNHYLYYRIQSSGGTTCVYYLDAYILKR